MLLNTSLENLNHMLMYLLIPLLQIKKLSQKKLNNLLKVTQLDFAIISDLENTLQRPGSNLSSVLVHQIVTSLCPVRLTDGDVEASLMLRLASVL